MKTTKKFRWAFRDDLLHRVRIQFVRSWFSKGIKPERKSDGELSDKLEEILTDISRGSVHLSLEAHNFLFYSSDTQWHRFIKDMKRIP